MGDAELVLRKARRKELAARREERDRAAIELRDERREIGRLSTQIADQAKAVDYADAELVPWWHLSWAPSFPPPWSWPPWRRVAAWPVYSYARRTASGGGETKTYWLVASRRRIYPPLPHDDVGVTEAVLSGLEELRERLDKLAATRPPGSADPTATSRAHPSETEKVHDLTDSDWPRLQRAWLSRDASAFLPVVEGILGDRTFTNWRRYEPPGDPDSPPSDDGEARAAVEVPLAAAAVVGHGPRNQAELRALAAAAMYVGLLAEWEITDEHERLVQLARALAATLTRDGDRSAPGGASSALPGDEIASAIGRLALALEFQLGCETDLFCSCPVGLENDAAQILDALLVGGEIHPDFARLHDVGQREEEAGRHGVAELARLVRTEGTHIAAHAQFLIEAANAASQLVTALENPDRVCKNEPAADGRSLRETIGSARSAAETAERALAGSVYATELRPYLATYSRVEEQFGRPSVLVDDAEVVLLYPFGLPNVTISPRQLVRELLAEHANDRSPTITRLLRGTLLDQRIKASAQETSTTFAVFGPDDDINVGARVAFPGARLMLRTTAGTILEDIDVDVRLGPLGNHYVRIAFTTNHRTVRADPADVCTSDKACAEDRPHCLNGPWTAHDVEQWVRRAASEMGSEAIWFAEAGLSTPPTNPPFRHLIDLAETLVKELGEALEERHGASLTTETSGKPHFANDLHANVHVLIVVGGASRRFPDGKVDRLSSAADLPALFGSQALAIPQRGLAAALEEWVRYDYPTDLQNLLADMGRPGDLLTVNGDVTLLCGLGSPNWVTLETRDVLEFGASVIGPLAAWSIWLRNTSHNSTENLSQAIDTNDVDLLLRESARIAENLGRARSLMDRLRSAQLMRSHRDREILRKFMHDAGVDALQESLNASIDAMVAQRNYHVAQTERIIDARKKRIDSAAAWMLGILSVSGLITLFDWIGSDFSWEPPSRVAFDLIVLLSAVAVLVIGRRDWSSKGEHRARWLGRFLLGTALLLGLLTAFGALNDSWDPPWLDPLLFAVGCVVLLITFVYMLTAIRRREASP